MSKIKELIEDNKLKYWDDEVYYATLQYIIEQERGDDS